MRYRFSAVSVAAAVLLSADGAVATDVLSQDTQDYELRVVSSSGEKAITIGPKGDLRSVCSESCIIYMPDGQNVKVGHSDIVFIIDGKISVYE